MKIRFAARQDVAALLDIYRPYVLNTAVSFECTVPTEEAFTQRFDSVTAQFPWLALEEDGVVCGYAYASRTFLREAYAWAASLSVYLRQDLRGRGYGHVLYAAMEALLGAQGYFILYGVVASYNRASCAFHERQGYRVLAEFRDVAFKHGKWESTTWYEKRLRNDDPTAPPTSWREIDGEAILRDFRP